ncbi:hypothetical protein NHX12_014567 [Muraenolepis orangiensis]|uniref:Dehydrogenase/reductase SDR family member on chromosome X n=1 Tax=Muraenolepis orangiensis TaxID=630683 RepID=A0A9Q0DAD5_9TELE|nr:hypothetical protein NHX12_014567 [Muraenolepis orangiensis]
MGFETAKHLASLGMHVLMVEFVYLDLASLKSIRQFAHGFNARGLPLHVLVNNAGIMLVPERETEDGFELHFGINYLGHFLLTNLLMETLARSGTRQRCSRVVNMASATHYGGTLDLNNLYLRQSKVALVLFTQRLQGRAAAHGLHVTANAADPGMVDTALYDFMCDAAKMAKKPFTGLFFRTPAEGASTAVYAAAAAEMEGVGGRYLYNGEDRPSADCTYDVDLQAALWKSSCALTGLQEA